MLYHFKESWIEVTIEAYFDDEKLVIEGYDIGKRVSESWGDSDYEYVTTVEGDNLMKLYPLMEVQVGDKDGLLKSIAAKFNTNTCYSEFCDFLEHNNIRYGGFSWA